MDYKYFEKESEEVANFWTNYPIDEIVSGITWAYIFKRKRLESDYLSSILELHRYKDLNVLIRSINKLIEYDLIYDK